MKKRLTILAALALAATAAGAQEVGTFAQGTTRNAAHWGKVCLGVRNDAGTTLGADGTYEPMQFDSSGNVRTLCTQAGTWTTGRTWTLSSGSDSVAVTGTFWQATQPVSIASMPSTPVTGTFWQATQPISGTVTANAGSGTLAVSGPLTDTQLRASAVPVSGSFWQATQPVSWTGQSVTATQGTGSNLHVVVDTAPTTAVTGSFWPATAASPASHRLSDGAAFYDAAKTGQLPSALVGGRLDGNIGALGGTALSGANVVDAGNTALRVNCVTGCTAGGSFADASAFTFGTTAVGNAAFVVDDTATNTVAENSAGAGRMSTNRVPYFSLHTDAGAAVPLPAALGANGGLKIEGVASGTAVPISGSVTVSSAPTTAVTQSTSPWIVAGGGTAGAPGTAVLTVQGVGSGTAVPVSGTVTVTDGAGALNVIVDSGSTVVTQGTGTNLHAVIDTGSTTAVTQATAANLNATVAQGAPAAAANRWLMQLHDGTTAAAVIAATTALKTDLSSVAGTATSAAAAGVQKVGVVGNAGGAFDAANNAAAPANVSVDGFEAQSSALSSSATAGNVRRGVVGLDGVAYMRPGGPLLWSCGLTAIAATLTQCQAAPAAGTSLYVTDITAVSDTATAGQYTIRYGTGSNCVTGTTTLYPAVSSITTGKIPYPANTANLPLWHAFYTPLKIPAATALCIICVATNTCTVSIQGYTAP